MSRSRLRRSAANHLDDAAATVTIDDLDFQPSVVCGGHLSISEYKRRSKKCTDDQLRRLQETPEFKVWQVEHGKTLAEANLLSKLAARLPSVEDIKYHLVNNASTIGKVLLVLCTVALLFTVAPKMTTGSMGSADVGSTPASATHSHAPLDKVASTPTPVQKSAPVAAHVHSKPQQGDNTAAIEKAQKAAQKAAEHAAQKAAQESAKVLKEEQGKSAALYAEIAAAKRAISAAQEQQRQLVIKLEEASKREAALLEQNKRLGAAKSAAVGDTGKPKWNFRSGATPEAPSAASAAAAAAAGPQTRVQRVLGYLSTWGISGLDAALLALETALLIGAAVLLFSLRRARAEANLEKQQFLVAYRRQKEALAQAEEAYEFAEVARATANKITEEAMEAAAAGEVYTPGGIPSSPLFGDNSQRPSSSHAQELKAELEKKVEEAAAQKSVWAQTAAQLLELTTSPTKTPRNENGSPSRARKDLLKNFEGQGSPPSPASVAQAVADRCAELRARVTAAESAAATATSEAERATKEREYSEQRASEVLTDNELLKERLALTKRALDEASDAKVAAEEHEVQVRSALEMAKSNLAAVEAEKAAVAEQAQNMKQELQDAAEREKRASRNSDHQEAQIEQLTMSLAEESKQKQRAEQRCAKAETDLNNLQLLADSLQDQVERLQSELVASHGLQTELKIAIRQLQSAHETVAAAAAPAVSPTLLQAARAEEAAAMERLSTVERRTAQSSPLKDDLSLSPLPALPSTARSISTPNAKVHPLSKAAALISRAGQISDMLSDMETSWNEPLDPSVYSPMLQRVPGSTSIPSPPPRLALPLAIPPQRAATLRSLTPNSSPSTSGSLTARMAKANQLFSKADQVLGQELPDEYPSKENSSQAFNPALRPYEEVPLLLSGRRESESRASESGGIGGDSAEISRLAAVVEESTQAAAGLLPAIASLGTEASEESYERLESAQQKVAAAMVEVEVAASAAQECRRQHIGLDAVAKERERQLQDCQLALVAAKQETPEDDRAIAAAAEQLEAAEKAKQNAAQAVYDAERAIHAAVSAELAARDALRTDQAALADALGAATQLLSTADDISNTGNGAAEPDAAAPLVAPIAGSPLRNSNGTATNFGDPRDAITALFDEKFQGVPVRESRIKASSVAASALAAQAAKKRSPAR